METFENLFSRRSVRKFDNREIEDEKIELMMKAAMAAPSAINRQPWFFYVVKDNEAKKKIIDAMPFGKYDSPIIIVPCVNDLNRIPTQGDLAYCDLGAATENILLAANDLGLGAVWCAVYPTKMRMKAIKKTMYMPRNLTPYSAVYVGYPSKEDKGQVKDKYDTKKVRTI